MTKIRWIIFAAICVLIVGGLALLSNREKVDITNTDPAAVINDGSITDRVYGNRDAKVVLIEYGDFQCPGCHAASSNLKTISEEYKNNIAFVFRNLPLTSIHPNALAAATVAEAAGQQGKYWEMHDLLYQNWSAWKDSSAEDRTGIFESYAQQVGLNIDEYKTALGSNEVSTKIARDRALASKIGADSTPTIIVNGTKLTSEQIANVVQSDGSQLRTLLNDAIKANGGTPPSLETKADS